MKLRHIIITIIVLTALWLIGNVGSPASVARADGPNLLTNPGFESDMTGWSTSGTAAADYSQTANPHTGSKNLAHWYGSAWTVTTYQLKTGLTNGNYRFKAWVKNWGVTTAYLKAENCGGSTLTTTVPNNGGTYAQYEITTIPVSNSQCQVGIYTSSSVQSIAADDFEFYQLTGPTNTPTRTPTPTPTVAATLTMLGADVSSLQRGLDLGEVYRNSSGTTQHPLDILQAKGVNYVRLRVWNSPASGYNDQDNVVSFAAAVKSRGLKLLVDLHYSDRWADPANQIKPAAWNGHTLTQLKTDVYNYTYGVCNALKTAGYTPDMMQIGNEITPGMLFEEGRIVSSNFYNLSELLKQGYNAVKACNSTTLVMLHTDKGGDNATARWWYDGVQAQGVSWDVTGLSYYCYWHGTISNMQSNVADMKARYNKPVVIVETSFLFTTANDDSQTNSVPNLDNNPPGCTGYSASLTGQGSFFTAVQNAVRNGGGTGVFYWEPAWVSTINGGQANGWDPANINGTGSGWDNQSVFNFQDLNKFNTNVIWTP